MRITKLKLSVLLLLVIISGNTIAQSKEKEWIN